MTTLAPSRAVPGATRRHGVGALDVLTHLLAVLTVATALTGALASDGGARRVVETARGTRVTLFGDGVYAADTVLVGAGNRGQDLAMLLVEVPLLLLAVHLLRRHGTQVAVGVLAGVLAFFAYFWVSMVFATAQNRLFPVYVAAASCAGASLLLTARRLDLGTLAAALPALPGRRALAGYLLTVAAALTAAWLPGMVATAASGEVAEAVGPYTSAVTEALDLGLVVPVVGLAAVLVATGRPAGRGLAFVVLVLNVSIGVLLVAQGAAQLALGVPLSTGEVVGKMLSFAVLTLVAGGMLVRMARAARGLSPAR